MTEFSDLPDDCLLEVLDRLPAKELFKMQRINRKFKQLAAIKMNTNIKVIKLYKDDTVSNCTHLGWISPNQVLCLQSMFESGRVNDDLNEQSKRALFFRVLAKCSAVKSIEFAYSEGKKRLPKGLLMGVVQRCPELECIKVSRSLVKEEEWNQMLEMVGTKIVHVNITLLTRQPTHNAHLLASVAAKCPNIRQVEWLSLNLTSDFVEALKLLPRNCWVRLLSDKLTDDVFEDVDELLGGEMDWQAMPRRVERISSLTIRFNNSGFVYGVNFAGLKNFRLLMKRSDIENTVNSLFASRFPKLEEFGFNANVGLNEDNYQALFYRMTSLKKMKIQIRSNLRDDPVPLLPGSATQQLKHLESITLNICIKDDVPYNWQPDDLLQQLEQYVDGIKSLKKLTIEYNCQLSEFFIDQVERMKRKQNRVAIDLIKKRIFFGILF